MSLFQKQPCKPKLWHYPHHASQERFYVLDYKQNLTFSTLWPFHRLVEINLGLNSPKDCVSELLQFISVFNSNSNLTFQICTADEWFASCHLLIFCFFLAGSSPPVTDMLLSAPVVSFFVRIFQIVLAMPNVCPMLWSILLFFLPSTSN